MSAPAPKVAICCPSTPFLPLWLCEKPTRLLLPPSVARTGPRVVSARKKISLANSHLVNDTAPSSPTVGSGDFAPIVDSAEMLHKFRPTLQHPELYELN